ncbi:MAG: hypothetical protein KGD70_00715 [Candidatus Lokiarchaeota archaeon]|nr:hypothetical protein [Candidatus Lokiarchaeota archaeon]
MTNPNLTLAEIKKVGKFSDLDIDISLSHIKNIENYRYLLIIKNETASFAKLTIYPISREKALKVIITSLTQIDEQIEIFYKKLQKYNIIHSSGLVFIDGEIYFECYLDMTLGDQKFKNLKIFLDKNKSKFKDIKLEELSLSKRNVNLNGQMEN